MGRGGIPRLIEAVAETLAVERERWVLWLPVAFGAGIAVYFALPAEPPLWLGAAVTLAVAACAGLGRRRAVVLVALLGIGAATAGFTVAQWRTAAVAEPMLSKRLGPTSVTGRIVAVERFPKGSRVSLERLRITRLGPQRTPAVIRLRLQGHQPAIAAGDWIRARRTVVAATARRPRRFRFSAPVLFPPPGRRRIRLRSGGADRQGWGAGPGFIVAGSGKVAPGDCR